LEPSVRHLDAGQLAGARRLASAPAGVADALQLLARDLTRPWTLTDLAETVAVSPAYLSRLFRRTVGRPPMAHLAVLRAEVAATRLLRTAEPVSQVGASRRLERSQLLRTALPCALRDQPDDVPPSQLLGTTGGSPDKRGARYRFEAEAAAPHERGRVPQPL
jgi:AraC-like DNA-binding protein